MAAINGNTRKGYESVGRQYAAFCAAQGRAARPITGELLARWFAVLSELGRHNPDTLRTYGSAMRHWHAEESLLAGASAEPNPMDDPLVQRTLLGARKILAGAMVAARQAQPAAERAPGVRLQQMDAARAAFLLRAASPEHRMLWAAMRMAIDGMLRPNEFLGSKNAGRGPLEVGQVLFHDSADRAVAVGEDRRAAAPSYYTLQLGQAKNDAFASKPAKVLRDPQTVAALWDWMHERLDLGASTPYVFAYPGMKLSGTALKLRMQEQFPGFTLKSLRRGGAAERVAANVPMADIAQQGGWACEAMVGLYAGPAAFRERAAAAAASHERGLLPSSSAARPPAAAASSSRGW